MRSRGANSRRFVFGQQLFSSIIHNSHLRVTVHQPSIEMVRGKRSGSRIAFRDNSTTSPKFPEGPQPQPWLIRDFGQAACGQIARVKREGLDSPSSTFFLCFGSRIAQSCFALFFRFFFSFWPQQNTFHVYLLLFFFVHASPRFFFVALRKPFFSPLRIHRLRFSRCIPSWSEGKATTDSHLHVFY